MSSAAGRCSSAGARRLAPGGGVHHASARASAARGLSFGRRLAAELGAQGAVGPGSLRVGLLDRLWTMDEAQLLGGVRLRE